MLASMFMENAKRVMVLYITEHSGHHSAALAIKRALMLRDPESVVLCVNAFQYAFPFSERIINSLYLTVIKRFPKIWERMYDNPKLFRRSAGIKDWVHSLGVQRLKKLIDQFKPEVIVCTQAFPCGIVGDYKAVYSSKIPLIGVLTDFAPHSFWIHEEVDYYVAHTDETKRMLMVKGVAENKIKLLGIPIDPKFAESLSPQELFANYGLDPLTPVIMMMGGGRGLGPLKDILLELDHSPEKLQLIVVCGLNNRFYHWISKRRFRNRILSFRYTDQVDRLMTIATVIITKPGGITTAECLAKKLPMIILHPIPGQEARNTQILIDNKVAAKIDEPSEILSVLKNILFDSKSRQGIFSIFEQSTHLEKPRSSILIANLILSL